ncbi:MAG: type II 3-dehydroquinate dehydratase [Kiritimatiellia bacterium]
MKVLVLNGPNLNMLGQREPDIYGAETLDQILGQLQAVAGEHEVELVCFQSNVEGDLVTQIQQAQQAGMEGIIMNPAAYTHTSIALRDAIKGSGLPCVEVHLSNTHTREPFRHVSLTAGVCMGQVQGFGGYGYVMALQGLLVVMKERAA